MHTYLYWKFLHVNIKLFNVFISWHCLVWFVLWKSIWVDVKFLAEHYMEQERL